MVFQRVKVWVRDSVSVKDRLRLGWDLLIYPSQMKRFQALVVQERGAVSCDSAS
jgi:hypothetical protein